MNLRYLVDTDVLSEPLRATPNVGVMGRLRTHGADVATAAPVWHELLYGCYRLPRSERRRTIEHYLFQVLAPALTILPYESAAAEWHASERARLGLVGKTPPFVDGQIAAVAYIHDLALVTGNMSDYSGFRGLRTENWTE